MGERGVDGVKGLAVRTVSRGKIEVMSPSALLVMSQDSKRASCYSTYDSDTAMLSKETDDSQRMPSTSLKATSRRGRM